MQCITPVRSIFGARRCRKCLGCIEHNRREWIERLLAAWKGHQRSHFLTFTFHPNSLDRYSTVQNWIKRCRKAKLAFKYVCVAEPHKRLDAQGNSRWHFHMLLFTQDAYPTVKLRHHWTEGWSHGRLVRYEDIR